LGGVVLTAGLGWDWPSRVATVLPLLGIVVLLVSIRVRKRETSPGGEEQHCHQCAPSTSPTRPRVTTRCHFPGPRNSAFDGQPDLVRTMRPATREACREATHTPECHEAGQPTHPSEIWLRSGCVEPSESVADEYRTHESHMRIGCGVSAHAGLAAHPAAELESTDRRTHRSGNAA